MMYKSSDYDIMLVDDDDTSNFYNEFILRDVVPNSTIHVALNGKKALELINNKIQYGQALPDVIFLDINMPIMDGFEFLEGFSQLNPSYRNKTKIYMLTSSSLKSDRQKVNAFNCVHDYLVKPLSDHQIRQIGLSSGENTTGDEEKNVH